jgi:hypothetical protein
LYIEATYVNFKDALIAKKVLHILNVEYNLDNKTIPTVPISYDEYTTIKNNPFKSNKNRAYYIQSNNDVIIYYNSNKVENPTCTFYYIEYPTPIITDSTLDPDIIDSNTGNTT